MSSSNKPIASVVRPGKAPEGPPGWEEKRIEKEQAVTERREQEGKRNSSGFQGLKDKVHNLGEKMHFVAPKNPAEQTDAQRQDASTMPEEPAKEYQ